MFLTKTDYILPPRKSERIIPKRNNKAIKIAQDAMNKYQMDVATWEENYGEKTPPKETFEERLRVYQREADKHTERIYCNKDRGAR